MSERDKTIGYERGRKGASSSTRWNDNWLEPHNSKSAKDREAGYQEGRRDRINREAEKSGSDSSGK